MDTEKKMQAQVAAIESACRRLGLTYEQLAEKLIASPETMRKWRQGYQAMGRQTLRLLESMSHSGNTDEQEPSLQLNPGRTASAQATVLQQVEEILSLATFAEQTALRAMITALHRVVTTRPSDAPSLPPVVFPKTPAVLPGPHNVVPLHTFSLPLGYIAAGVPGDSGDNLGKMYVAVPQSRTKGVDFAVKVHGDSMVEAGVHHGDILLMSKRDPKNGDIVAARVDGEFTLKKYHQARGGKVTLTAANEAFVKPIVAANDLEIVGVMVGKL